jgi:hypothetical protein
MICNLVSIAQFATCCLLLLFLNGVQGFIQKPFVKLSSSRFATVAETTTIQEIVSGRKILKIQKNLIFLILKL